jgi:nucleoside-diphosphate-sugar epimerase
MDDSAARQDWGWKHQFGLEEMTEEILKNLALEMAASHV